MLLALTLPIILFLATTSSLLLSASAQANSSNKDDSADIKQIVTKDQPSSVNLASILQHQEALKLECHHYQEELMKNLEKLVRYEEESDYKIHLPRPLPIKVPAVCLYLIDSFGFEDEPTLKAQGDLRQQAKLDIVNWIFNEDALNQLKNSSSSSSGSQHKRDTSDSFGDNDLLEGFLYQPADKSPVDVAYGDAESQASGNELHENINRIINDDQFKKAVADPQFKRRMGSNLSPVILVPGLLGSRLQSKVDKPNRVNVFCSKQSDWQDMWLSLRKMLPIAVDCWLDNVKLEYNKLTGYSKLPDGIEARVPDFGSVESVRYLDVNQPKLSSYMAPLIDRYEQLGYIKDVNLLAAPYDFRLAPRELKTYFEDLKLLIDQAHHVAKYQSKLEENKKVTLVCHSMGCTHLLIFLRLQTASWRQSRIKKMIALSSPWGGAIKALKALVVGDQLELPLVSEVKMRKLARTFPSIAYLLPQLEVFTEPNKNHVEPSDKVLVQTPEKTYHLSQLEQLLLDLNLKQQLKWFNESVALIKPFEPLKDVRVDCIHSLNVPTPETLVFKKQQDFPDGEYTLIKGDGDGTVNFESLMICANWAKQLPDMVKHKIISNTNHIGVLSHKTTLDHITDDSYL